MQNKSYMKNIVYHELYHCYNKTHLSIIFSYIESLNMNRTYTFLLKNFIDEYWTVYKSNLYSSNYSGAIEEINELKNDGYKSLLNNIDVLSRACGEFKYYAGINHKEYIVNKLKKINNDYAKVFKKILIICNLDLIGQKETIAKILIDTINVVREKNGISIDLLNEI